MSLLEYMGGWVGWVGEWVGRTAGACGRRGEFDGAFCVVLGAGTDEVDRPGLVEVGL